MTREEAIEIIKRNCTSGSDLWKACELFIPELAESEDENFKNKSGYYKAGKFWKASTLWNAVKDKTPLRVPNRYILQNCTWNIGSLQDFAYEVKNVQEASLDYPIILDMNGNILDGAHRIVKAYLEGKDIDIVYLGDDEWPEPDYDEEKAVKESEDERIRKKLIEYFNHYREDREWWEGITSRDIISYLEKQKEQGPLSKEEEYILHRVIEYLEDETCPSEWISLLHDIYCLPYKKQKEQKPVYESDFKWTSQDEKCRGKLIDILELTDIKYPATKDSRDKLWEWLKELPMKFPNKDAFIAGTLDNDDKWLQTEEILGVDGNPTYYKQKPAEWDDYTKTNLNRALQIIKDAKGKLQGYQSDDGIYECDKAIECLEHFLYRGLEIEKPNHNTLPIEQQMEAAMIAIRGGMPSKSQEWSEEDEEALDMCLDVIPKKWKTKSGTLLTKWLKDNIHLKQQWSEEDEKMQLIS